MFFLPMMLSIFFIVTVVNYFKRMKAVYAQIYWIMVFLDVVDLFVFFLLWAPQTSLSTLKWDIVGTPVLILQSAIEIHVLILYHAQNLTTESFWNILMCLPYGVPTFATLHIYHLFFLLLTKLLMVSPLAPTLIVIITFRGHYIFSFFYHITERKKCYC